MPHKCLLAKLNHHSIRGPILACLKHVLSQHTQRALVYGSQSVSEKLNQRYLRELSSVPIFSSIYINDLAQSVTSQICLFADDCLLYCFMYSDQDHQTLQFI